MMEYINNLMSDLSRNQLISLIVVLVISIATALYYLYKCIRTSEVEYFDNSEYAENFENKDIEKFANKDVVVRMFHVKWCGYCKRTKPAYMKFMQKNFVSRL